MTESIIEAFKEGDAIHSDQLTAALGLLNRLIQDGDKVPKPLIAQLALAVEKYVVFMHQRLVAKAEELLDIHEGVRCG